MKYNILLLFSISLFLSFKPGNDDKILRSMTNKSKAIVLAKITEQKRCVRMEDGGIEECNYTFKVIKVYKGKRIKDDIIETTIMNYALVNKEGKMPLVGEQFILFLTDQSKLTDTWIGIQAYTDYIDKFLTDNR
ncbi:MAG: hypothetical protein ACJ77K_08625 [Bacteroidia bacterium]